MAKSKQEQEREEHYYEAQYQAWRGGANMDNISRDVSDDDYDAGRDADYTASREISRARKRRQERLEAEESGDY